MQTEVLFILAVGLVGVGTSGALIRRNVVSVILSLVTAAHGVGLAVFLTFLVHSKTNDGIVFGFTWIFIVFSWFLTGLVISYNRWISAKTNQLGVKTRLRN
ncbi:MAG: NADH-quinone oxidoreductase subunit K [Bacteriovoracia bacterium]